MKKEREKWINEVFQSLEGMEKAEASPFLDNKIMSRISGLNRQEGKKSSQFGMAWAMAFSMLLCLNIYAGWSYISSNHVKTVEAGYSLLSDDLGLTSKTFNY